MLPGEEEKLLGRIEAYSHEIDRLNEVIAHKNAYIESLHEQIREFKRVTEEAIKLANAVKE